MRVCTYYIGARVARKYSYFPNHILGVIIGIAVHLTAYTGFSRNAWHFDALMQYATCNWLFSR